jgi:transposase
MDAVRSAVTEPVRRLEVFTGAGRRRKWSNEDKARIVAEILEMGDSVCAVARRHALSPQQLFGWRRQLRESAVRHSETEELQFVPALVDVAADAPAVLGRRRASRWKSELDAGAIEVEVNGVTIRGRPRRGRQHDRGNRSRAEGAPVIGPTGAVRVMVATKPVDFRKGAEGLATLVRETMTADPFSGTVYVFRAKRTDRIELIFWDGTGLCLFAKRLEDGIEKDIRGRSPEERRITRQQKSRPLADTFEQWLRAKLGLISQKGKLAEAIRYALSRWEGLTRFIDDGIIEIDNNASSDRSAPSRSTGKNALFAGSDGGAEHWAIIASLIETCNTKSQQL